MLRIYLDQWAWIALSHAAAHTAQGASDAHALSAIEGALHGGQASFPLSIAHYFETWHVWDQRRRHQLARVMARISRYDTMAAIQELVPAEIDGALHETFGRPPKPRAVQVFGRGAEHAFRQLRIPRYQDVEVGAITEEAHWSIMQFGVLAGPPWHLGQPGLDVTTYRDPDRTYKDHEEGLARRLAQYGADPDLRDRAVLADEFIDITPKVLDRLATAGISQAEFIGLGQEGMTSFLERVPTRWTGYEIRRLRHQNPERKWLETDLVDMTGLCAAAVYCDVVVAEKDWAHLFNRTGLSERFNTRVVPDLGQLARILRM